MPEADGVGGVDRTRVDGGDDSDDDAAEARKDGEFALPKVISKGEANRNLSFLDIRRECVENGQIITTFSMNYSIPGLPLKLAPQDVREFKRFATLTSESKAPFKGKYYFAKNVEKYIEKMTERAKLGDDEAKGWDAVEEIPQPKFVILCELVKALLGNPSFEELVQQRRYTYSRGAAETAGV
jgi:hypothetical protein